MDYIEPFSDRRHDASCIHCGLAKAGAAFTRDHVPSKSLLDRPFPPNLPTFDICQECNNRISSDEEYLNLVLICILEGTCEPDQLKNEKAARALARNKALLVELRRARKEYNTIGGERHVIWHPDLARMIPPLVKNARGHFAYELGEQAEGEPASTGVSPLQSLSPEIRAEFERVSLGQVWPEVGSRMMTRLATGMGLAQSWIVVQPGVYRYSIQEFRIVRIVVREYLAFEAVWD